LLSKWHKVNALNIWICLIDGGTLMVSGNWVDDMRSGHGWYRYVNGDIYEGEWSNHVRHGNGKYTYSANGVVYSGTWENGRRVGTGTISVVGRESVMRVIIKLIHFVT